MKPVAAAAALEELADVRASLAYVARNMTEAFGGRLGELEANAHAMLVQALGQLVTVEEHVLELGQAVDVVQAIEVRQ